MVISLSAGADIDCLTLPLLAAQTLGAVGVVVGDGVVVVVVGVDEILCVVVVVVVGTGQSASILNLSLQ